ncbi:MAG: TonB-dependent receptor [Cellvibrionaceae bacterium]|nr:TonB-dependent receptor [Cellvibrionaceae bacterium]
MTDLGETISPQTAEELERFQPDQRITFSVNHRLNAWKILLRANHVGETFENLFNDTTLPVVTSPVTLFDLEVSRDFGANLNIALGAKNITDEYPDEWEIDGNTGRTPGFLGAIYPLNHPAGINGGFY